jgi:hypothetical protein
LVGLPKGAVNLVMPPGTVNRFLSFCRWPPRRIVDGRFAVGLGDPTAVQGTPRSPSKEWVGVGRLKASPRRRARAGRLPRTRCLQNHPRGGHWGTGRTSLLSLEEKVLQNRRSTSRSTERPTWEEPVERSAPELVRLVGSVVKEPSCPARARRRTA